MIRSGFSSPLRFVLTRSLVGPSPSSSSSLRRPFTLSSPSLADGLFPTHGKQGIKDIDYRGEFNTVEGESIEAPKEKLGVKSPEAEGAKEGGAVDVAPSSTEETASSTTTPTTSTPSSEDASSSSTPTLPADSSSAEESSSIVEASIPSLLTSPPLTPFQPSLLLPNALLEERRSLPPIVTSKEWSHLKGPRSTVKAIRLSLTCTKNNTKGLLTWCYDPATLSDTEKWNGLVSGGKFSGGSLGFKGAASGGSEAGHQVVVSLFRRFEEENEKELKLRKEEREAKGEAEGYLKEVVGVKIKLNVAGFGQGREAFMKALKSEEGSTVRACAIALSDHTPVARSWPRPKKARRV